MYIKKTHLLIWNVFVFIIKHTIYYTKNCFLYRNLIYHIYLGPFKHRYDDIKHINLQKLIIKFPRKHIHLNVPTEE